MLFRVDHGEDTRFWEIGQTLIPRALEILGANSVNLLERTEV